ncbi:sensor histidine kinase [Sporosarcina limicola]|uniref:histidine kinase n=1 Tax=Sporosarcina limicola TaxID=34101 RepID=A0A927MLL0_9BACL|nr:HAMP domain-containing sensor histidine kinase [Sporosarcina limicola]MBE1555367.1 signal transduction histidine kinase [Sporosarcina limicola]
MGKVERPIRRQIITSFYLILLLSAVATIVTWGIIATIFLLQLNRMNPANYYEKQIPSILKSVEESKGQLLTIESKNELEKEIPLDGIAYQVVDKDGNILFGSTSKRYVKSQKALLNSFNKNLYDKTSIVKFYPTFNDKGEHIGAIGFRYELSLAASNPKLRGLIIVIGLLTLVSPFVYFYVFSYLIGKRFSKQIEQPFNHLMVGARKIQSHDLDFQLVESKTTKELNQLVRAFEDMRIALQDSLLRQWQLEEERKEMVAAIAHDLRTPLTIIHGHVEGLLDGGDKNTERLERYLQTIFTSTQRSIRLIDQLNEVSAIDRSNFTIEPIAINVVEFIQNKTEEYKMLCAKKNISIACTFSIETGLEPELTIDSYRISQVLDNIITNSIRYCPKNGLIEWKTTMSDKRLVFEIIDNGPGFQNKGIGRMFEKFYREDQSRSGHDANLGLGLYIAQMIVKQHNGSITIQNRPEGGAYTEVIIGEVL